MCAVPGQQRAVLVAHATGHGSTREVAERIGAVLEAHGHPVVVRPCVEVEDLDAFDAVVVGSAVYDGMWLPPAGALVRRRAAELARRPVWLFSVGSFGDDRRIIGPMMLREPRDIAELREAVGARGYRVFAGVMGRERWPLRGRLVFRALGGRYGDNRDWQAIDAWAAEIAGALDELRSRPG